MENKARLTKLIKTTLLVLFVAIILYGVLSIRIAEQPHVNVPRNAYAEERSSSIPKDESRRTRIAETNRRLNELSMKLRRFLNYIARYKKELIPYGCAALCLKYLGSIKKKNLRNTNRTLFNLAMDLLHKRKYFESICVFNKLVIDEKKERDPRPFLIAESEHRIGKLYYLRAREILQKWNPGVSAIKAKLLLSKAKQNIQMSLKIGENISDEKTKCVLIARSKNIKALIYKTFSNIERVYGSKKRSFNYEKMAIETVKNATEECGGRYAVETCLFYVNLASWILKSRFSEHRNIERVVEIKNNLMSMQPRKCRQAGERLQVPKQ